MDIPTNRGPSGGRAVERGRAGDVRVISSCADARAILVNAAARVPADSPPPVRADGGAIDKALARGVHLRSLWMWGCDTDRRGPCRKAAAAAIGPSPVERLRPFLESRSGALLNACVRSEEADLVADFARPLVRDALMELFGVAPTARASLQAKVDAMAGFIPGNGGGGMARYFALAAIARLLEEVWAEPLPPLADSSGRLRGAVQSGELSLDEALAQATLLLFGNSYTTLDALAGLMARLAEEPLVWAAVRDGSLTVPALIEEGLRLGPPTHLVLFRDAWEDIPCPGGAIPAGTRIVLPLDSLNRDPACFERGDAFEPGRSSPPHLAFGAGGHMCIGLHLARAVIRTAIEALIRRLPEFPAGTRPVRSPGILGGASVTGLVVPAGAIGSC